jgi:Ca2+:H+ antiporter
MQMFRRLWIPISLLAIFPVAPSLRHLTGVGLGLAIMIGSFGRGKQIFKRERAEQLSSLLIVVVITLLLPAVFNYTDRAAATRPLRALTSEELSIGVSIVLLALYGANLFYTLVTHRDVFAADETRGL